MPISPSIKSLPTRYEPLVNRLGEEAVSETLVPVAEDLRFAQRLVARLKGSGQGKILFVRGNSGSGKSTFVHSLAVFLRDDVSRVVRAPKASALPTAELPGFIQGLAKSDKVQIVNLDGRETPNFDENEFRGVLGQLNALLRDRTDLLICWPVEDLAFAQSVVALLSRIAGKSPFGSEPVLELTGLAQEAYLPVLERLLQVANWTLEDAAIEPQTVAALASEADNIGTFLDDVQALVYDRFDVDDLMFAPPKLVFALSSGRPDIRALCRGFRRADTYYLEAARLMMHAKRRKVGRWWQERSGDPRTALPHVIAHMDAQLVSISPSAAVHAAFSHGADALKELNGGTVGTNKGASKVTMTASEMAKFFSGKPVDVRATAAGAVKPQTLEAYSRIQALSATHHKAINEALVRALLQATADVSSQGFEQGVVPNLNTDWVADWSGEQYLVEFHHKAVGETTESKVSMYILEKLKEYAIECGFTRR